MGNKYKQRVIFSQEKVDYERLSPVAFVPLQTAWAGACRSILAQSLTRDHSKRPRPGPGQENKVFVETLISVTIALRGKKYNLLMLCCPTGSRHMELNRYMHR
ncbi:hypothetical protein ElyMa_002022400 [Elysia marginata]|uniref:Uncharacterized protein n=1 Tax=Elysia marginata TaxID=1093978 RepID=A0AAV4F548_9GAST|nr:hypothetical protein ElyMa_002022400 [Elysia marginata]